MITISGGAVILALGTFFISRLVGGVVGEYGKQLWFKRIEPTLYKLLQPLLRSIGLITPKHEDPAHIELLENEAERLAKLTERLLIERDILQCELMRYRVLVHTYQAEQNLSSCQRSAITANILSVEEDSISSPS